MASRLAVAVCATVALALGAGSVAGALAAFTATADNAGNVVTAASDFRAPAVTAVTIGKAEGGATGFVAPGGSYRVYATVEEDTGNPASGTESVTANVESLTSGATATELVAGSYSAGGSSYTHRSALLTADPTLAEGPAGFSITATDAAANAGTAHGTATVDDTPPEATDVQAHNASGGTAGLAEANDAFVLDLSEAIEPGTVLDGWSGAPTDVVVRLADDAASDYAEVHAADGIGPVALGTVALGRTDYVTGEPGGHVDFGDATTPSTMELQGGQIVVTLGAYVQRAAAARATAAGTGTAVWSPSTAPTDLAANPLSAADATESGAADVEL